VSGPRRAERASQLRWWVWAVPALLFLLGFLLGALIF
jgi:hypothetical protein